jgi:kynureninase
VAVNLSREAARRRDAADPLRDYRSQFVLPPGVVYLDGNSLGALPRATAERIAQVITSEWGKDLIRSWNVHDWINSPLKLGAKLGGIIGAAEDEVVVTETTSINLFRLVLAALELRPERTDVVTESGNFPTDLYVTRAAVELYGRGKRLKVTTRKAILDSVGDSTALVVLTHVHYRTGEMYDLPALTREVHARGALMLWDLSHSAGAVPVDLDGANVDFAVGCGYKYLNGGPGAPAFLYVSRRHHSAARNVIPGWHGHAAPFDFTDDYKPAQGVRRFLAGTPSIIANSALETGVDIVRAAGMERIAAKSRDLSEYFIALVEEECKGFGLKLVSPRLPDRRGSHVSYAHLHGYEIMQALIDRSVIGDFRAPDVMRFGFTPLYTSFEDIWLAVDKLREILAGRHWEDPRFRVRALVT